jgi:hypothetical protein
MARTTSYLRAVLLPCLSLLLLAHGAKQAQAQSSSDLIRFLTYQSDRPGKLFFQTGLSGCGDPKDDREAARSLVRLGVSAVPDLEAALQEIETNGPSSEFAPNAEWLLLAYARINGPAAYVRLRSMEVNLKLKPFATNLDNALSLSLSLTSYVSRNRALVRILRCRADEPRDVLDQLILALEQNDRPWLRKSLGPDAKAALDSIPGEGGWSRFWGGLWPHKIFGDVAVGFHFEVTGRWSEPEETLEERGAWQDSGKPRIETRFTTSSGDPCAQYQVRFLKVPADAGSVRPSYRVNNPDLMGLLNVIASCAGKK